MDMQIAFNITIAIAGALCGYVLKSINDRLKSLQDADSKLSDKMQHIEVLIAGQYVTNVVMEKFQTALFNKLDRMELKLDGKADKP